MRRSSVLGAVFALALCRCSSPTTLPAPHGPDPSEPAGVAPAWVNVGAARADITPPPGVTTFGHGPDALVSNGYWTRLYCRVFAFETATGRSSPSRFVIAACELPAMSALLQRTVAEQVSDLVPPTRLMLSATHTHAGPAHYFDGMAFGGLLSTRLPGFDPKMLHFVADRISAAIRRAFADSTRASLSWAHYDPWVGDPGVPSAQSGLWGLSWNRTRGTDFGADVLPKFPAPPPGLCRDQQRIDPALHVLRIEAVGPRRPLGALTFLSMHPTVLPNTNRLLGGDVFGVISRDVEGYLRAEPGADDPLGPVINGNEGDVSPKWRQGSKPEAVQLGHDVAARVIALVGSRPATPPGTPSLIAEHFTEVDLAEHELESVRAEAGISPAALRTCETPELGESFDQGACDHPTTAPVAIPTAGFDDSVCQRPKRVKGGFLQHLLAGGPYAFPEHVPVAALRIDDSLITFLPGEFTVRAGRTVAERALAHYASSDRTIPPPVHSFVAGLSNEYILYVTTPDEFAHEDVNGGCAGGVSGRKRQTYEGSATLYGPSTLAAFGDATERLARAFSGSGSGGIDVASPDEYGTGPIRDRFPGFDGGAPAPPTDSDPPPAPCAIKESGRSYACFTWSGPPPGRAFAAAGPWLRLLLLDGPRLLPVTAALSSAHPEFGTAPVDDAGFDFVTRVARLDQTGTTWVSLLALRPEILSAVGTHAVVLAADRGNGRSPTLLEVDDFAKLKACTGDALARCGAIDDPPPAHSPFCNACGDQCR